MACIGEEARGDACEVCVAIAALVRNAGHPAVAYNDATLASLDAAAEWLASVAPSGGRREALLREAVEVMRLRRWAPRVVAATPARASDCIGDESALPLPVYAWLETHRAFVFDDGLVVGVEQAPVPRGSDNGMGRAARTGCIVWNCALALALQMRADVINAPVPPRIIELGAGVGVVGLVAARSGARAVVCTDLAEVCPLLRRNVAEECSVVPLRWGDAGQLCAALDALEYSSSGACAASSSASAPTALAVDAPLWVVASDVAYFTDAHADLIATLVALSASAAAARPAQAAGTSAFVVWIAHQYRHPRKERPFFDRLLPDAGFVVTEHALPAVCRDGARIDLLLGQVGGTGGASSLDAFSGVHLYRCVRAQL